MKLTIKLPMKLHMNLSIEKRPLTFGEKMKMLPAYWREILEQYEKNIPEPQPGDEYDTSVPYLWGAIEEFTNQVHEALHDGQWAKERGLLLSVVADLDYLSRHMC
jgi:hypothetical protein